MNLKTNFLAEIIARKRQRLDAVRAAHPSETIATLRARAVATRRVSEPHALRRALAPGKRVAVIAEIKRRSPSKGDLFADLDPVHGVVLVVDVEQDDVAVLVLERVENGPIPHRQLILDD